MHLAAHLWLPIGFVEPGWSEEGAVQVLAEKASRDGLFMIFLDLPELMYLCSHIQRALIRKRRKKFYRLDHELAINHLISPTPDSWWPLQG